MGSKDKQWKAKKSFKNKETMKSMDNNEEQGKVRKRMERMEKQ